MWNPVHGATKAFSLGARDHVMICGHKHVTCYLGPLVDASTGEVGHCFQIGSYKEYDRYAREKGFRDQHVSPCVVTVINTELSNQHPDRVTHFWDAQEGADYLNYLRAK